VPKSKISGPKVSKASSKWMGRCFFTGSPLTYARPVDDAQPWAIPAFNGPRLPFLAHLRSHRRRPGRPVTAGKPASRKAPSSIPIRGAGGRGARPATASGAHTSRQSSPRPRPACRAPQRHSGPRRGQGIDHGTGPDGSPTRSRPSGSPASPISRRKSGRSLRGCASTGPPRDPVKPDGLVRHAAYGRAGAFVRPGRPSLPPLARIASTGR
jgi:hypothetical protein